jgi:hypothetical protein
MTWSLSAHGQTSPEAEEGLKELLALLLGDPRYGLASSQYNTASHNGPLPLPTMVPASRKEATDG